MPFRHEKIDSNVESIIWCSKKYVQAMFFTRASRAKNITCWERNKDQSSFLFRKSKTIKQCFHYHRLLSCRASLEFLKLTQNTTAA